MDANAQNPASNATPAFDALSLNDDQLRAALTELDAAGGDPVNLEDILTSTPGDKAKPATEPAADAGKDTATPPAAEQKKVDSQPSPPVPGAESKTPANPTPEDAAEEKDLLAKLPAEIKHGSPEAKVWLDLRKGEARQAKTWQQINADRESAKKEKAEAAQTLAQLKAEQEARANTFDAQDYADAAQLYRKQGKLAEAEACDREAAALKAGKLDTLRQRYEQAHREDSDKQRGWHMAAEQAAREIPALLDANSPETREARQAFADNPVLKTIPAGPIIAARIAAARLEAQTVKAERDQLKQQREADQAELRRLNGLLSPSPSGHARGPRASDSDPALRSNEELLAMAMALDAGR